MCDFTGLFIGRKDVDGFRKGFADRGCGAEDLRISHTVVVVYYRDGAYLCITANTKDTNEDILVRIGVKVLLDLIGDLDVSSDPGALRRLTIF